LNTIVKIKLYVVLGSDEKGLSTKKNNYFFFYTNKTNMDIAIKL